jgi:hypothetical protein
MATLIAPDRQGRLSYDRIGRRVLMPSDCVVHGVEEWVAFAWRLVGSILLAEFPEDDAAEAVLFGVVDLGVDIADVVVDYEGLGVGRSGDDER